ncbi:phage tail tape measure protein [Pseudomonas amygdali pv. lachrymans]|uniref:Lambda family phage tail tape measure protein n=2 Tax=Pseudomonas amygdali pv. lachrymans TaxID=53707 RepID=A0ABR5KXN8_PSEAV|nr:phage tail tape measure protein [Pseudomonas amygdali]AXH55498.1 phage tail tape measure protein [Pseudomonas amygdali pv. lachrymans str. M301315]KPC20070.1 Lambda family phage tail tape measure protein [Pseudomonas amygdali pv. lachrymans]PWD00027.1 phage tail tape measure protein [Pseudomonas amygdali pv. lachrymans]QWA48535.1 phage tail tape measure protein [Pseudomonas amygdali pv. lachrymans]RMT14830.1 Lambda family phage tail tape measure protein [Pseudomonas amygdali pv. lachrymans]
MSKSLGTLTLDLVARIGSFTGPLDRASQEAKKRNAEIAKSFESLAKGVGVAIAGVPAALTGLVAYTAGSAKEISNLAALAGLGTTEFQKYAAGAKTVGVEQDKLADIFKDTNDKLGDFFNTGGGELKDFFEVIAPKVGVTAESFKKLNSAEALQLYVSSLEKANVSQAEMTFYMEGIADEASALVPLLRNGGKQFKDLGEAAESAGAILSVQTIAISKEFSSELAGLIQNLQGAKNKIADDFMPVVQQMTKDLNDSVKAGGGVTKVVGEIGESMVTATAFVVSAGDGVVRVFKIVSDTLIGMFSTAVGYIQRLDSSGQAALSQLSFGDVSKEFAANAKEMEEAARISFGVAAQAASGLKETIEAPMAGEAIKKYISDARGAAAEYQRLFGGTGFSNEGGKGSNVDRKALDAAKQAAKDAAAAAKKLSDTFKGSETDLQRQIALINTSADAQKNATEVDKIRFEVASGKLVGINAVQQKRLEGLASELDALQKLKVANEEEAKAVSFLAALKDENAAIGGGFDMELAGAGMGDKARDRLKQDMAIQEDYTRKAADLQAQRNSGDISAELYAKETGMLSEALAERMVIQQDYYNRIDEAQSNWMAGVSDAWQNYVDAAEDYSAKAADFVSGSLDDATTGLGNVFADVATDVDNAGEAVADFASNMSKSVINALSDMAAQWLIYQGIQLLVGKSGQSAAATGLIANAQAASAQAALNAYASTAGIPLIGPAAAPAAALAAAAATAPMVAAVSASALAGMAHNGMDNIPKEGTWLLDGGERVLNPNQNRDLTKYLADKAGSGSGGAPSFTINAPVNVQAQPGMTDADAARQGSAISSALEAQLGQFLEREMRQGGRLWRRA